MNKFTNFCAISITLFTFSHVEAAGTFRVKNSAYDNISVRAYVSSLCLTCSAKAALTPKYVIETAEVLELEWEPPGVWIQVHPTGGLGFGELTQVKPGQCFKWTFEKKLERFISNEKTGEGSGLKNCR